MASFKDLFNDKTLSIEDLLYLAKLLDTNLSINECFNLLANKQNEYAFKNIQAELATGQQIENIIADYLPKQIRVYMVPLLKDISFSKALNISLDFYNNHKSSSNTLMSSITYPCILLFVTITALYLFDLYGMDSIFGLIGSFDAQINLYQNIRTVFRICINVFYYGILLAVLLVLIFSSPKRITLLYLFLSKYFPNSLVTTYYCEQFVSLLLICVNNGYKTKESLEILKAMKSKPIVSFLAFHLDENLLKGDSLKDAIKNKYYDSSLSRFIKIANFSNDFEGVLNSYTVLAKQRLQMKMKQYASTIQICTYVFIGAIIIFIYQILFMPMQAISAY